LLSFIGSPAHPHTGVASVAGARRASNVASQRSAHSLCGTPRPARADHPARLINDHATPTMRARRQLVVRLPRARAHQTTRALRAQPSLPERGRASRAMNTLRAHHPCRAALCSACSQLPCVLSWCRRQPRPGCPRRGNVEASWRRHAQFVRSARPPPTQALLRRAATSLPHRACAHTVVQTC
jgi:hypothetical protein